MKRSAILINVARGEVVDEAALYQALLDCVIAGSVIDVWYVYPSAGDQNPRPAHQPFHELPNVIMTPHVAGWTQKLMDRRWSVIVDNLRRLASSAELGNVVHRA
jgi:phosphoglycerate dehydrogenase-like enzyme